MELPTEICDHFKTLEIRPSAQRTLDDVKKKFRQLAKIYHSNKSDFHDAKKSFQKISHAYEQLVVYFGVEE